jgi:enoyl-CoA hydratase/carnithine racemase
MIKDPETFSHLRLVFEQDVARLLIARPERHNAMDLAMWQALPALVAKACDVSEVRAIVLTWGMLRIRVKCITRMF